MGERIEGSFRRAEHLHWINAGTNAALAGSKIALGLAVGSPALAAHGVENLSDLLGNALAWASHRLARRPPDEDHHYGHGFFEALGAMAVGAIVLGAGVGVIWRTLAGDAAGASGMGAVLALSVALLSAAVCEGLSRLTWAGARALGSPVLAALARDKRSDALTSLGVVVGLLGSLAGISWAELPVAVAIGLWICWMGVSSVLEGLDVLLDRVPDKGLRGELARIAAGVPGVVGVQEVRVHPLGTSYRVELEISVDGSLSVHAGHAIAEAVEGAILSQRPGAQDVHVHVNPA
jgi:cation diffusion facilitator family transporter